MNKSFLCTLILLIPITPGLVAQSQSDNDLLIPVTYSSSKGKPRKGIEGRIQIRYAGDSVELWAFAPSMPKVKKFTSENPREKIGRSEMKGQAKNSLDSIYELLGDTSNGFNARIPSKSSYYPNRDRYLLGKKTNAYFANQWVKLGSVFAPEHDPEKAAFKVKKFLRAPIVYRTEQLPGGQAWKFPALDPWNCVPALEQFFKLKKLQGYGLKTFKSVTYRTTERKIIRKEFELYFEKDQSIPDPAGLLQITDYLRQNEMVILHAEMSGSASLEGRPKRNQELKVQRARVVTAALRKYSNDPIHSDTIIFSDHWDVFRDAIRKTKYAWVDTLSNEAVLELIARNDTLARNLEPIFKLQRKAKLNLVMAKILSRDDQLAKISRELFLASAKLFNPSNGRVNPQTEAYCMGILEYLFEQHLQGNLGVSELEEIVSGTPYPGHLYVLLGYQSIRYLERKKPAASEWNAKADYWFTKAMEHLIALVTATADPVQKRNYLRMCADFQTYEGEMALKGIVDISRLCAIPYPDQPVFMGLILHHYALLQILSSSSDSPVSCFSSSVAASPTAKPDSAFSMESFYNEIRKEFGIKATTQIGGRRMQKPTFDTAPKGAYYYLLKRRFLNNDVAIMKLVEFADGSSVELNAFNLYDLLSVTLQSWDPMENHFYDKEVRLPEIEKLIVRMKKSRPNICAPQLNQLYLSYHLKALHYLSLYAEPGSLLHRQIAESSLEFIMGYYKARAIKINSELDLYIVKQLNLLNWLPGARPGSWYGYEILRTVAGRRLLNEEELKLYAHYLKMYDPQFNNPLPTIYEKEKMVELWTVAYSNKVIPLGN